MMLRRFETVTLFIVDFLYFVNLKTTFAALALEAEPWWFVYAGLTETDFTFAATLNSIIARHYDLMSRVRLRWPLNHFH